MSIEPMLSIGSTGSTTASSSSDSGRRSFVGLIFVSALASVVAPGTSAGILLDPSAFRPTSSKTDAGQSDVGALVQVSELTQLRRICGLTWHQMAVLFGVSRRAVHFWASGKTMTAAHSEHLQRTLSALRTVDRGSAPANRTALFAETRAGLAAFDLLVQRQYGPFVALLGRPMPALRTPINAARVSVDRLPIPPSVLANAREEPVHRDAGATSRANVTRVPRAS